MSVGGGLQDEEGTYWECAEMGWRRIENPAETAASVIRNPDDCTITVEAPAMVDLKTWEAAQARFVENKQNARRNLKHQNLMSKRGTCGNDGLEMSGNTVNQNYSYYRCVHQTPRLRPDVQLVPIPGRRC